MLEKFTYILHYRREGRMTWLAHLDIMKVFERSLRRAKIPLAWSEGFNPRPQMVFALPIGMGIECRYEPIEIELTEHIDTASLAEFITSKMPVGLELVDIAEAPLHQKSLMALVYAADYRFLVTGIAPVFAELMESEGEVWVERKHKGKIKRSNLKDLIENYKLLSSNDIALRAKAGSVENLRPELVLKAVSIAAPQLAMACQDAKVVRERVYLAL